MAKNKNQASTTVPTNTVVDNGVLSGMESEINFGAATTGGTKYPWDKWFNGGVHVIAFGRDYGTTKGRDGKLVLTNHMFPKIVTAARHRYKICSKLRASRASDAIKAKLTDAGYADLSNTLIIQARPMMADEVIAEDEKRAEEKIRAAELAAEKAAAVA